MGLGEVKHTVSILNSTPGPSHDEVQQLLLVFGGVEREVVMVVMFGVETVMLFGVEKLKDVGGMRDCRGRSNAL